MPRKNTKEKRGVDQRLLWEINSASTTNIWTVVNMEQFKKALKLPKEQEIYEIKLAKPDLVVLSTDGPVPAGKTLYGNDEEEFDDFGD